MWYWRNTVKLQTNHCRVWIDNLFKTKSQQPEETWFDKVQNHIQLAKSNKISVIEQFALKTAINQDLSKSPVVMGAGQKMLLMQGGGVCILWTPIKDEFLDMLTVLFFGGQGHQEISRWRASEWFKDTRQTCIIIIIIIIIIIGVSSGYNCNNTFCQT